MLPMIRAAASPRRFIAMCRDCRWMNCMHGASLEGTAPLAGAGCLGPPTSAGVGWGVGTAPSSARAGRPAPRRKPGRRTAAPRRSRGSGQSRGGAGGAAEGPAATVAAGASNDLRWTMRVAHGKTEDARDLAAHSAWHTHSPPVKRTSSLTTSSCHSVSSSGMTTVMESPSASGTKPSTSVLRLSEAKELAKASALSITRGPGKRESPSSVSPAASSAAQGGSQLASAPPNRASTTARPSSTAGSCSISMTSISSPAASAAEAPAGEPHGLGALGGCWCAAVPPLAGSPGPPRGPESACPRSDPIALRLRRPLEPPHT
mmetsp:Transcript_61777/g.194886  ORF Transcript_61777/g.194886 Transcript_61777/m.194886 type:complete len:318 (+) Transcript_61777:963-1916(+)